MGVVVKVVPPYAVWSLLRYLWAGVGDIAVTGVGIAITGVGVTIAGVGMAIAVGGVDITTGVGMVVAVVGIVVKVVPPDVDESLSRSLWTGVGGRAAK